MKRIHRPPALLLAALLLLALLAGCSPRTGRNESPAPSQDVLPAEPQPEPESSPAPIEYAPFGSEESEPQEESQEPADAQSGDEEAAKAMSADFSALALLDGELKEWGSGGGGFDSMGRPVGPVAFQERYGHYGAFFLMPDSKDVYLTFDEGYEYGYTPVILDVLKENDVKAVFFITGHFAKSEPDLVRRIIDDGHVLGNHSDKHKIYPDLPLSEAADDLLTLHEYVKENFDYEMNLFRFPEGKFSEQTMAMAQSLGYSSVFWSFAYKDYDVNNQPLTIDALDRITRNPHPGGIYLLHAVSRTNSEVLPEVISILRGEGYTLAPLVIER